MFRVASLPRTAPVPLMALGLVVVAAGILLQRRGVDLPDLFGSTTTFGVMVRLGGAFLLCGLALFAGRQILGDPRLERRLRNLERDLPVLPQRPAGTKAAQLPAVTPQQMAAWQMRLAARSSLAAPEESPVPERRLGQMLHRAAIALIAGAFTTLLTLTLIHQIAT